MPDLIFTDEEIKSRSRTLLGLFWTTTVESLIDAVGEDRAVRILGPCMVKSGEAWGIKLGQMFPLSNGEKGVADMLRLFHQIMKLDAEVSGGPGRADVSIFNCPFTDCSETLCKLFDSFAEGLCRSLDPELRLVRAKTNCQPMACHWKLAR